MIKKIALTLLAGIILSFSTEVMGQTLQEVGKLVFADTSIPKHDTAKVLMLIGNKETGVVTLAIGYEVTLTEFIPDHFEGYNFFTGGNETKHIRWLDENKKPFPKNTIIWLTQKTNQ